ncbi:MAG TPA: HAMP domain-containing sensor histidine kinase [Acidimicrobiia bacterium]|nr:HAMP domain-containing sensor histidine kinase [Acidimicrobiia bacterium]
MRRPGPRFRTRLLVAIVAVAFGVLVVSVAGTAALARRTTTDAALDDLREDGPPVAESLDSLGERYRRAENQNQSSTRAIQQVIAGTLRLTRGTVVVLTADGRVVEGVAGLLGAPPSAAEAGLLELPEGLDADDLDIDALTQGNEQSGQRGSIVFLAEPLAEVGSNTPVLILTESVDTNPLGRAAPFFLLAAGIALVAALLVAAYLVRRLTRPLAAMKRAAQSIAAGDLSARVQLDTGRKVDDELAGLARALDGMATELESARGLERGFLMSVSHDLRTPLTSIKGYADAIAEGAIEEGEDQARAAAVIASEARRLERLVADLLDLARLDAHQFSLTPQPVDASAVVGGAVEAFRRQADEIGVNLDVAAEAPVPADADPERLAQIVANLVENALKYARTRVTVGVAATNGSVRLRVDDDGPGIDPADLPRVFDRLYTSRTVPGRKVGTGLGLAIVRELAAAMGGSAAAERVDGTGTRFVVEIPAAR